MRVRTAKTLAQRIDLHYFKHAHGMRRWRYLLSAAAPLAALLWVSAYAAAGSRAPYSAGPVSTAHAFAENRCEVCHTGSTEPRGPRDKRPIFRAHTTDASCQTCHDAPAHAANQTPAPACATCHQEHRGRVQLAKTDQRFCLGCHADLKTTQGEPRVARSVGAFSVGHPEFRAVSGAAQDPARVRFNHAVHMKEDLRGPRGPEKLQCGTCHVPEAGNTGRRAKRPDTTGLMAPITFAQNCARCHPLFFDERIDQAAPHVKPEAVRTFVRQALEAYIRTNPDDISKPDSTFRRVPLNFPRPPEPPARNAEEWIARRAAADERLLWNKTCVECHEADSAQVSPGGLPVYAATNMTRQWMPRAGFDHGPHVMITCASCHAAAGSSRTSDVLLPTQAVCASCHAPSTGARLASGHAENRCFECHRYHDWSKSRPVAPSYSLTDLK